MPRRPTYPPLRVLLNGERVGTLLKDPAGAVAFAYEAAWLSRAEAVPVSLSLPLREDAFRGPVVQAVFENLLPDSEGLRRLVAEKVGARGTDAYSLLAEIGRDCVGALQFVPENEPPEIPSSEIQAETMSDAAIEALLNNLVKVPLGLEAESDFRISVAGVQEKTALLRHNGRWKKPRGVTPTSHIIKTQIGRLPNGLDLSTSVETSITA